tara:strand:+ start:174 stop:1010 length:837 start_codon:yes stop_codon:yes gene_type:complete
MANLLEALQPQMQDTTSQLSTLLRAKSGKAVGAPATAISTQQEQAAVAQAGQAMQPIQQAATLQQVEQQQQARGIEQQVGQQQAQIAQSRQANQVKTQLQTQQLLQDLEQNKGKIDANRYQASMEQLGQNLRLNNQKYVDNLQREGSRARLNDDIQFREQVAKSVLQDNKSLLEKQLGNRSILSASDREFSIAMARMGVQDAWQMFRNESNAQQSAAQWSTGASLINTGLGAYGTYQERVEKAKDRSIARGTNVQRSTSPFGQDQTDETLSGAKGRQS